MLMLNDSHLTIFIGMDGFPLQSIVITVWFSHDTDGKD